MSDLCNTRRWESVDAPVRGAPGARSPAILRAVVAQLDPAGNPRYQPGGPGVTWCNILLWDVTRALGCEVPHWLDEPRRELNVNGTLDWLELTGPEAGWREVDERDAARRSSAGYPVVALWRNPSGAHGHVAVLLPARAGELRIAQAGRHCLYDAPLREGFGAVQPIRFFTHE